MPRLLFIDDNPEHFRMILNTLEFIIDDLKVDYSRDVSGAIDLLCQKEYDIIVMDVFVPLGTKRSVIGPKTKLYEDLESSHLGGLEILHFLEKMNEMPTLLLHTACLDANLINIFGEKAKSRIPKPSPPEVFINKISQALCD
jgi:CheY-like chemotaxis protein